MLVSITSHKALCVLKFIWITEWYERICGDAPLYIGNLCQCDLPALKEEVCRWSPSQLSGPLIIEGGFVCDV